MRKREKEREVLINFYRFAFLLPSALSFELSILAKTSSPQFAQRRNENGFADCRTERRKK
jgi:hypothetical protein